jgi:hypothetical protein
MGNGMLTLKFTNLIKVLYKWLYYLYDKLKKSKGAQYFNDIKNHEYEVFVYLDNTPNVYNEIINANALTCGSRFLYYNFQKYVFSGSSQGARI